MGAGTIILRRSHIGDKCLAGLGSVFKNNYSPEAKLPKRERYSKKGERIMKIFVATDIKVILSEGRILAFGKHSTILRRYYDAFGPIVLCARYIPLTEEAKGLNDITDIVASVVEMGSLYQMFLNRCNHKIEAAMKDCQLVVGRCPSIAAYKAADIARKLDLPFFAESMGCAWDAYWNHGLQGKLIAPYMFLKMKCVVRHSDYALYVTNQFLQKRYPCKNESVAASNVLLSDVNDQILERRMQNLQQDSSKGEITLMTTAAVNVKYKGQQYVIRAIPKLNDIGIRIRYILVGEGDDNFLRKEASRLGVSEQVEFKGRLPLNEVFELLDRADIYIQPSLQEGLPRAMIEAMSRGCACIGAKTAGIPELIERKYVIRRKSVSDIVSTISNYAASSKEEKRNTAERNYKESKNYEAAILNARRNAYYEKVKQAVANAR